MVSSKDIESEKKKNYIDASFECNIELKYGNGKTYEKFSTIVPSVYGERSIAIDTDMGKEIDKDTRDKWKEGIKKELNK